MRSTLSDQVWRHASLGLVAALALFAASCKRTAQYEAAATVKYVSGNPGAAAPTSAEWDGYKSLMESLPVAQAVETGLTETDRSRVMAAFPPGSSIGLEERLLEGRKVEAMPSTGMLRISFRHADPELVAKVANQFADAFVKVAERRNEEAAKKSLGDLPGQVEARRKTVQDLEKLIATAAGSDQATTLQMQLKPTLDQYNQMQASLKTKLSQAQAGMPQWTVADRAAVPAASR